MMLLCHNILAGQRSATTIQSDRITIGRDSKNDIVLDSLLVAPQAAVLVRQNGVWMIQTLGKNGCKIGDQQIGPGESIKLTGSQPIVLFPFEISFENQDQDDEAKRLDPNDERASLLLCSIHRKLLALMDIETDDTERRDNPEYLLNLEHMIEQLAIEESITEPAHRDLVSYIAGQAVRQALIEFLFEQNGNKPSGLAVDSQGWSRLVSAVSHREHDLSSIVNSLFDSLELSNSADLSEQMDKLDSEFEAAWLEESDE